VQHICHAATLSDASAATAEEAKDLGEGPIVPLMCRDSRAGAAVAPFAHGTSLAIPVWKRAGCPAEEDEAMAGAVSSHVEHDEWVPPTGEQLADRVFGLVIAGVCGVIVLMVALGGWWAA
jgi:hypothetical protein